MKRWAILLVFCGIVLPPLEVFGPRPVLAQEIIPPMPDLSIREAVLTQLACEARAIRVLWFSKGTPVDPAAAWYKPAVAGEAALYDRNPLRPPFMIALYSRGFTAYWLDLNRDGKPDEYGTAAQYRERYPKDNLCEEILPLVTD